MGGFLSVLAAINGLPWRIARFSIPPIIGKWPLKYTNGFKGLPVWLDFLLREEGKWMLSLCT